MTAPRTAYEWARHNCQHTTCTWQVVTFFGTHVGVFPTRQAVIDYISQHPGGPRK